MHKARFQGDSWGGVRADGWPVSECWKAPWTISNLSVNSCRDAFRQALHHMPRIKTLELCVSETI